MQETLITLLDNEFVKISYFDKKSDDVVLSFSSTPRLPQGEEIAEEQFIRTLSSNNVTGIFIIDKQSSYGNKINFGEIAATIAPIIINAERVHAVGYCMGGFLAILMSKVISLHSVVAITPQWSIHPDILPESSYLREFTNRIDSWEVISLENSFNDTTKYFIFNSNDADDQYQIQFFPEQENLEIFEFGPATGHDLPEALGGKLEELMFACINDNPKTVKDFIDSYYK